MTHIEATIARIPTMTAKSRRALHGNAETSLTKSPANADAHRILDALDAFEDESAETSELEVTGLLSWENMAAPEDQLAQSDTQ